MPKCRQVRDTSGSPESEKRGAVFRYQSNTFNRNRAFSDNSCLGPLDSSLIWGTRVSIFAGHPIEPRMAYLRSTMVLVFPFYHEVGVLFLSAFRHCLLRPAFLYNCDTPLLLRWAFFRAHSISASQPCFSAASPVTVRPLIRTSPATHCTPLNTAVFQLTLPAFHARCLPCPGRLPGQNRRR